MVLKISTGKRRGASLASTDKARELRPTQSLVREAIFNILNSIYEGDPRYEEKNLLDLFAGIGSVGFEFLSNDIGSVTFVEKDLRCIKLLRSNLGKLNFSNKTHVLKASLPEALKQIAKRSPIKSFDIVFMDPPYSLSIKELQQVITKLLEQKLIRDNGILILEYGQGGLENQLIESFSEDLNLLKTKAYGETFLYFYKHS